MRSARNAFVLVTLLLAISCSRKTMAGKYVCDRDRTPRNTLELKTDGTFVLQEDGTTLTGTWSQTETRIDIDIRGGGKASIRIDGQELVDSGEEGGRWTRQ